MHVLLKSRTSLVENVGLTLGLVHCGMASSFQLGKGKVKSEKQIIRKLLLQPEHVGMFEQTLCDYAHPICKKHRPSGLCFIAGNKTNSWKILFDIIYINNT